MRIRNLLTALFLTLFIVPADVHGADWREEAGVGIGLTLGNVFAIPLKATVAITALAQSALAFATFGGDTEVAGQILKNGTAGPYLITPSVARSGIGQRPELEAGKTAAREPKE